MSDGKYKSYGHGGSGINFTWVCFRCRLTRRLTKGQPLQEPCCSNCHRKMHNIGDKIKIPRKKDNDGWKELTKIFLGK